MAFSVLCARSEYVDVPPSNDNCLGERFACLKVLVAVALEATPSPVASYVPRDLDDARVC